MFNDQQILAWGPIVLFVWSFAPYTMVFIVVYLNPHNRVVIKVVSWIYFVFLFATLYAAAFVLEVATKLLPKVAGKREWLSLSILFTHWLIPSVLYILSLKGLFPNAWANVHNALMRANSAKK